MKREKACAQSRAGGGRGTRAYDPPPFPRRSAGVVIRDSSRVRQSSGPHGEVACPPQATKLPYNGTQAFEFR